MKTLSELKVKIYADGADKSSMLQMYRDPLIKGFTTNPTLMRKAGVKDYKAFAKELLETIKEKPISFEVFSDEFDEMERQAKEIASWADNLYVKIPITNTEGQSSNDLISRLSKAGMKINVTGIMTPHQVRSVIPHLVKAPRACVSVFAGRVADSGRDPLPIMRASLELLQPHSNVELIWASPREILNVIQADSVGCHIITVTNDLMRKISLIGKDLNEFSLDTVRMFYEDAKASGYSL